MTDGEARAVLGLPASAGWPEIRQAYRDSVRAWHPDRFEADAALRDRAAKRTAEIIEAYEVLKPRQSGPGGRGEAAADPAAPAAAARRYRHAPATAVRSSRRLRFDVRVAGALAGIAVGVVAAVAFIPHSQAVVPSVSAPPGLGDIELAGARGPVSRTTGTSSWNASQNGAELITGYTRGRGSLHVWNGTDSDAVVMLFRGETPSRSVFVRAGSGADMRNVASGSYRIIYTTGRSWNGREFAADAAPHELERPAEFVERDDDGNVVFPRLSISLATSQ